MSPPAGGTHTNPKWWPPSEGLVMRSMISGSPRTIPAVSIGPICARLPLTVYDIIFVSEGARRVGKSYTEGRGGMRNDRADGEFYRDKVNIKPWEVTDFSATGARERRLIQKSKQPKGNLISTAEFYAVNG